MSLIKTYKWGVSIDFDKPLFIRVAGYSTWWNGPGGGRTMIIFSLDKMLNSTAGYTGTSFIMGTVNTTDTNNSYFYNNLNIYKMLPFLSQSTLVLGVQSDTSSTDCYNHMSGGIVIQIEACYLK